MIKTLDSIILDNGEKMVIRLLIPPEPEYSDELAVFLRHKGDQTARDIQARLKGQYAADAVDKYFIGKIDGQIAGQLWYGFGKKHLPVANFGHVYTALEHRRKGVTAQLMKYFIADFKNSPALGAFCSSYREWVARIYQKDNFKPLLPGKNAGPMILANTDIPEDFSEFQKLYYLPEASLRAVKGSMKYHHEIDALLNYSLQSINEPTERVFASNAVSNFRVAIFMQEDQRGHVYCAVTPDDRCAGWSFCLNPFALDKENQAPIFDYELHPLYKNQTEAFVKQSLNLLREKQAEQIFSYCSSEFTDKIKALKKCGFKEEAVIKNYCEENSLYILRIVF